MNQKGAMNWQTWIIIILVLLNIASLSGLWILYSNQAPPPPRKENDRTPLEDVIIEGVGLDEAQALQFRQLHLVHRKLKDSLDAETFKLKGLMQKELFAAFPDTAKMSQMVQQIAALHAEHERQLYNHFLDLKRLCRPDQFENLEKLLNEMLVVIKKQPKSNSEDGRSSPPDTNHNSKPPRPKNDRGRRPPPGEGN